MLLSCCNVEDRTTPEFAARSHIRSINSEIYNQYLACYALSPEAKEDCIGLLEKKYLRKKQRRDLKYSQAFQLEAEKLGFRKLINDLGLPCETIHDSPEFIEEKQAYLVRCFAIRRT